MGETTLHLFTGENVYALEKELIRWKKAFCEKHGPENFLEVSGKTATFSDFLDAVSTMPFIAEKRLVLIRGVPSVEREEFKSLVEAIHPQVLVVVADPKPDKRLGVTKDITSLAEVKDFPPLSPGDLFTWARALAISEGASIDRTAFDRLVSITGSDQWVLESELKKLSAFAAGPITVAHVDEIAVPSGEQVVWKLTDLVGNRKADEALRFLHRQLERGEEPYGLWVILMNMIKNLTLVWSAIDAGIPDERSISSAFGMHFLSVRGLLPLARSLDGRQIRDLVNWVSEADIALKSGGFHYTSEHQGELVTLAERVILKCR